MSIIIDFKLYKRKFKKGSKSLNTFGCDIIIFPGIRYSRENNVAINDENIKKIRKMGSPKRSGVVIKRGA